MSDKIRTWAVVEANKKLNKRFCDRGSSNCNRNGTELENEGLFFKKSHVENLWTYYNDINKEAAIDGMLKEPILYKHYVSA